MRRANIFAVALVCILSLAFYGCGGKAYDTALKASDASYERVVALSRSIGDLWLLAGGELKGITEDGLDLEGIDTAVSVGTVTKPNIEAIISLEPDLVLVSAELSSHLDAADRLDFMGIEVMAVSVNSFGDYADIMKELTRMTGNEANYDRYVSAVSDEIDEIRSRVGDISDTPDTYLVIRVSATKNKVLKNDYFACEIFNDLGLINIADDESELDDPSIEWIAEKSPDHIFIIQQGDEGEADKSLRDAFMSRPVWNLLPAVENGNVYVLPKELFQYKPNASWARAYEYAYGLIYDR